MPHLRHQQLRGPAAVKPVRPVARDTLERGGEFVLAVQRAGLHLAEIIVEIRNAGVAGPRFLDAVRHCLRRREAIARQPDGGLQQLAPRALAIALVRQPQAGDRARDTGGPWPDDAGVLDDLALAVQVHVTCGGGWRRLAVIQAGRLAVVIDQHETAAAEIAGFGIGHGQHECRGHGRIHGIAAVLHHFHGGTRAVLVGRGNRGLMKRAGCRAADRNPQRQQREIRQACQAGQPRSWGWRDRESPEIRPHRSMHVRGRHGSFLCRRHSPF